MSEVVETIARAMGAVRSWDGETLAHNLTRDELSDAAQAAITALEVNGWAIVPCEPSEEMCEAGWEVPDSITDSYRAMISIGKAKA